MTVLEVGVSTTTVQRVIHNDLKLFPYKVQILQKQADTNKEERSEFCQTINERIENKPGDLGLIVFSDEVHFHLSGHVNKQNMRFLASQQPLKHIQSPLNQEKITVWCVQAKGSSSRRTFFENNDGNCVTHNAERYIEMIQRKFVFTLRRKRDIVMNTNDDYDDDELILRYG